MAEKDFIDGLVARWKEERPDLDTSPMSVLGRITRLQGHLDRLLVHEGLARGEFDVLATLRRAGEPFRLNPRVLTERLMLSAPAMTNRLDNLENRGLIRRMPDPDDRRALLIELTREGRRVIDQAMTAHMENEERILGPLTKQERRDLAALLKKLLLSVEG
jgi:DNA-binding MarR family transcriptional regulator